MPESGTRKAYTVQMTGLDATRDTILSIACFVTDAQLVLLDQDGYEAVIHHSAESLANMNEWCIKTHTASGLVEQCTSSKVDAQDAASGALDYIKRLVPNRGRALLAGNSVHADKMFLLHEPWFQILDWLHYRILDVSALKEATRRWASDDVLHRVPHKQMKHEAKSDILESIEEARYYRSLFQQSRNTPSPPVIASFHSSSTLDSAYESSKQKPAGFVRKDSYGNTITKEAAEVEATLNAKRKAGEVGLHYPSRHGGREPNSQDLGNRGYRGTLVGGNGDPANDDGFRTDVP